MLRTRVQTRTLITGVQLSVSHGLGTTLDAWNLVCLSNRGRGTLCTIGNPGPNRFTVISSLRSCVTFEMFAFVYQGRLY
jgi:hypothetical protein